MLLYLDICCFNRPFDDQSQLLTHLQTEAKLFVQQGIRDGIFNLAWSAILDLENEANPDREKYTIISEWRQFASCDIPATAKVEALAMSLEAIGVKAMDALHVASAVEAGAEYFLTTDKFLLRKLRDEPHINVLDPVDFLRHLGDMNDENGQ